MKIIVAPDSFKGSISARELCRSMTRGIKRVFPEAEVLEMPLADGGEGTVENMILATNGKLRYVTVSDPLGRSVEAYYGILGNGKTVVIEMAQASGLPLLTDEERAPLLTTSYGTGELIRDALDQGYREFIIGLGGSAINDGGAGMLRALGIELYDSSGKPIPEGGGFLTQLAVIDDSGWDNRVQDSTFTVAGDVMNVLCGENGASAVFGPQKGATPEEVKILDQALYHFAEIILKKKGIETRTISGGGAAGGMGASLIAFLNAEMKPGIGLVMDAMEFDKQLYDTDFIVTGEGKIDTQTMSGKVVAGVCKKARKYHIPVIALCGMNELNADQLDYLGIQSVFTIVSGPCTLESAIQNTALWTEERMEQVFRLLKVR